jgi:acetylornithine deacetylase/succinyl-diaminopimelate desuccinylase-like protein
MPIFKDRLSLMIATASILIVTALSAQTNRSTELKKHSIDSRDVLCEKYFKANRDAHLKEYTELVSIQSISSIPSYKPDVEKAATWIVSKLKAIGMTTAQLIPTEGNPVVYGSWENAPGKPTVLIYAHYDVQPVKDAEWNNPPFKAKIDNGKITGRGTSDDKSGVLIPIWAAEAMLNKDKALPVNIKFMFDGEEEIGSPHFRQFLIGHKELLKADYALNADGDQFNDSIPSILMSLRGGVQLQFSVKTANIDAHSGIFGGKTPNAAVALSQIISSLYNKDGSVAVEGFYDKVVPLTAQEKEMIKNIPYDATDDMKILGSTAETGDTNYTPLERIWYRPTLEIIGMQGGYTAAEGYSNIVPGSAMARITCRLVANQSPKDVVDNIVKHINKNCPVGATINYTYRQVNISAFKFPADTKEYRYVADALTKIYGRAPLQIATGGSVGPLIDIKEQLGIYAYSLGFQQKDEQPHGVNEFFRLSSIDKGEQVYCYYLQHMATANKK